MGNISITGITGNVPHYTIKVYEAGNSNPILTEVTITNSYSGTFNHVDGQSYYATIEKAGCTSHTTESFLLNCNVCNCPSGYSLNTEGTGCVRVLQASPTVISQPLTPTNGSTSTAYGITGVRIFNLGGFTTEGAVIGSFAFSDTSSSSAVRIFWAGNTNTNTGGRLNLKGTWANGINQPYSETSNTPLVNGQPFAGTLSYCYSINVPTTKVYYIGIAGDDYCGIKVNGTTIIQQIQLTSQPFSNFWNWNIYPVQLQAGQNIIEMNNTNLRNGTGSTPYEYTAGAFAAEIYDNTLNDLRTATSESVLNILFSTGDYRVGGSKAGQGFCTNHTCPSGYSLDTTNPQNPVCKKVEYLNCNS